jgi:hypothetical protein
VFTIATNSSAGPTGQEGQGRMAFLGWPKFGGLVAVIGVVIALLAYVGDLQERRHKAEQGTSASGGSGAPTGTGGPASASPTAPASPTTIPPSTPPTADGPPVSGTGSFALTARKIDTRTVGVEVTPPAKLTRERVYWFFIEIDWRDGNIDYYPREKLPPVATSFVIDIPSDARLDAGRAGRVYALTAAQSADAEVRLGRQSGSKEDDFFPEKPGDAASAATTLPFGT